MTSPRLRRLLLYADTWLEELNQLKELPDRLRSRIEALDVLRDAEEAIETGIATYPDGTIPPDLEVIRACLVRQRVQELNGLLPVGYEALESFRLLVDARRVVAIRSLLKGLAKSEPAELLRFYVRGRVSLADVEPECSSAAYQDRLLCTIIHEVAHA